MRCALPFEGWTHDKANSAEHGGNLEMLSSTTFWTAIAFFMFIGLLVYLKVPSRVLGALDDRAERIRDELEQAKKLREEAQALLADYERRQREAEKEAESILDQARREAALGAQEHKRKLAEMVERQSALAETKIAQSEAQAIKDIRIAAADLAAKTAEKLISDEFTAKQAEALIDQSIKDLKARLN